ncbi:MAG TPA: helix-turn-helix transcriptional regulator [Gammaproteobacteria bacterium]|nr:helix-turn-helix transcriptional regulator [Gammaproteobacteria bacterium]
MTSERYKPVPFDVEGAHKRWMKRPGYAAAYDALADEFAALGELLCARQQAGMTQAQVAERMGIAQATVARLESSAGNRKHAPSLATLRKYADAVGCDLRIRLQPKAAKRRRASTRAKELEGTHA